MSLMCSKGSVRKKCILVNRMKTGWGENKYYYDSSSDDPVDWNSTIKSIECMASETY